MSGLQQLRAVFSELPSETPITVGLLVEKINEAVEEAEYNDWEANMRENDD